MALKNIIKIIQTHLPIEGKVDRYFLILTEIYNDESMRSYYVEIPLWFRWTQYEEFEYYQPNLN